jgi:hypothetical protein
MRAITFRALQDQACLKHLLGRLCSVTPSDAFLRVSEPLDDSANLCHHVSTNASGDCPSQQLFVGSAQPAYNSLGHSAGHRRVCASHKQSAQLHHAAYMCTGREASAAADMSMPLAPGSQVIVDMSLSSSDVRVLVNDDPEAMSWEVQAAGVTSMMTWSHRACSRSFQCASA